MEQRELEEAVRANRGDARTEAQIDLSWALAQIDPTRAWAMLEGAISDDMPPRLRARALITRLTVGWVRAEFPRARENGETALGILGDEEDHPWRARALNSLGAVAYLVGDYEEARSRYVEAASIVRRRGGGLAAALNNLGMIDMLTRQYSAALRLFEKAYVLACASGDRIHQAHIQSNLANVHFNKGSYAEALEGYEAAAAIYEELGAEGTLGDMRMKIGSVHTNLGNHREALPHFRRAIELLGSSERPVELAGAYQRLGELQAELPDVDGARDSYARSIEICEETGYRTALPASLYGLAKLDQEAGQIGRARELRKRALEIARELDLHHQAAEVLHGVGLDHLQARDLGAAEAALSSSAEFLDAAGAKYSASLVHRTLCDVYLARDDLPHALKHLRLHGALRSDVFAETPRKQDD